MAFGLLLAGLVVYAALRDRTETTQVAVADRFIGSGGVVTEQMVRWEDLPAGSDLSHGLVDEAVLARGSWVAARPIQPGEPLTAEALVEGAPRDGLRSMSVPVPRERAAGGALAAGDRVDVIDVVADAAVYVVVDVEVLGVSSEMSGSDDAAPSAFFVTLAVDDDEALRLAGALADGQLDVVRSTGTSRATVDSRSPLGDAGDMDEDEDEMAGGESEDDVEG